MITEIGKAHLEVYRTAATDEMRNQIRAIAIGCLLRAHDEGGDVYHYLDMERFQSNDLDA